jgi:hypothetical protein
MPGIEEGRVQALAKRFFEYPSDGSLFHVFSAREEMVLAGVMEPGPQPERRVCCETSVTAKVSSAHAVIAVCRGLREHLRGEGEGGDVIVERGQCQTLGCGNEPKPGDKLCKRCIGEKVSASMKQEFVSVPVEVVRGLKEQAATLWPDRVGDSHFTREAQLMRNAIRALPDPKPDVVEECARAMMPHMNMDRREPFAAEHLGATRAALRRYRELLGMDRDPELEDT